MDLFWKGKEKSIEDFHGIKNLRSEPFQVIESFSPLIKESDEEFEPNLLIKGDSELILHSLLQKYSGKIKFIYIDPPFATGGEFNYKIQIGEGESSKKSSKWIRKKAYDDSWKDGIESYLSFIYKRLLLMKELLSEDGSIYMHLDWHVGHYVKIMMDEIFGIRNFRNEIIWAYPAASAQTKSFYVRSFDIILYYTISDDYTFNDDPNIYMEYSDRVKNALNKDEKGVYYYRGGSHDGKKLSQKVYLKKNGVFPRDVWTDIPYIRANTLEYQGFSTQKPERLLKRILLASTRENDLIADFFGGSGTTLAVAEKLNRRWIGCDISKNSIHIIKKRILDIGNSNDIYEWKKKYGKNFRPFKILKLSSNKEKNTLPIDFFSKEEQNKEYNSEFTHPSLEINLLKKENKITIELTGYKIPYEKLIANDIKENISTFSDWIDYWSIDFDFHDNESLNNRWVSYRTTKNRSLELKSDSYTYEKSGKYKIMVKTIDICGVVTQKIYALSI